jgi:hypothetical protein
MSNNKSLRVLRGTRDKIISNKDTTLEPGQILYNMSDNYLTVGDNSTNGKSVNGLPITVRDMNGYF